MSPEGFFNRRKSQTPVFMVLTCQAYKAGDEQLNIHYFTQGWRVHRQAQALGMLFICEVNREGTSEEVFRKTTIKVKD